MMDKNCRNVQSQRQLDSVSAMTQGPNFKLAYREYEYPFETRKNQLFKKNSMILKCPALIPTKHWLKEKSESKTMTLDKN